MTHNFSLRSFVRSSTIIFKSEIRVTIFCSKLRWIASFFTNQTIFYPHYFYLIYINLILLFFNILIMDSKAIKLFEIWFCTDLLVTSHASILFVTITLHVNFLDHTFSCPYKFSTSDELDPFMSNWDFCKYTFNTMFQKKWSHQMSVLNRRLKWFAIGMFKCLNPTGTINHRRSNTYIYMNVTAFL